MALPGIYETFQNRWSSYQTIWVYSDPHFNDEELAAAIKDRPTAEEQVKRINAKCGRRDALICLGDVGDIEPVRKIRAEYKILIMGNHDKGASNYKRKVIKRLFNPSECTTTEILEIMKDDYPNWKITISEYYDSFLAVADNMLFDEVYEGALMIGEKLILSHEPVNLSWAFNLHGHVHDKKHKNGTNSFNVCSDIIGYEPINLNQLLKNGGHLTKIETIHRTTIDNATKRKQKKNKKLLHFSPLGGIDNQFEVKIPKGFTLSDFIKALVKERTSDHGCVYVGNQPILHYYNSRLFSRCPEEDNYFEEFKNRKISCATAIKSEEGSIAYILGFDQEKKAKELNVHLNFYG